MSETTSMNFNGSCIVATDAGGGQANITVGSKWLIASHSFTYAQSISGEQYFYGDSQCGWDSCLYDLKVDKLYNSPTLNTRYVNCGIPNPYILEAGDKIEVCGIVYCSGATETNAINIALNYFVCSEVTTTAFTTTNLATRTDYFKNDDSYTSCFNLGFTVEDTLDDCNVLFLLGFNVSDLPDERDVKISYTFKAYTNCTQ
jgi:hypothetical protein